MKIGQHKFKLGMHHSEDVFNNKWKMEWQGQTMHHNNISICGLQISRCYK